MIEVKHSAGNEWVVSVRGSVITHHRVRVSKADLARFAEGHSPEHLLQETFRLSGTASMASGIAVHPATIAMSLTAGRIQTAFRDSSWKRMNLCHCPGASFTRWHPALVIFQPETVIGWQRAGSLE